MDDDRRSGAVDKLVGEFHDLLEEIGVPVDSGVTKAVGLIAAAIMAAGAVQGPKRVGKRVRRASRDTTKALRRLLKALRRYARKHPLRSVAALVAMGGIVAEQAHESGAEKAPKPKPRKRRKPELVETEVIV